MSHSRFCLRFGLYLHMHGLIFETSISLLAGSTRQILLSFWDSSVYFLCREHTLLPSLGGIAKFLGSTRPAVPQIRIFTCKRVSTFRISPSNGIRIGLGNCCFSRITPHPATNLCATYYTVPLLDPSNTLQTIIFGSGRESFSSHDYKDNEIRQHRIHVLVPVSVTVK